MDSTERLAAHGLLWLEQQAHKDRWHLNLCDISRLLGGVDMNTLEDWLQQARGEGKISLPQDIRECLAALLKIDCLLAVSSPPGYRYQAFNLPTTDRSLFNGSSIRSYLTGCQSVDAVHNVHRYLRHCR